MSIAFYTAVSGMQAFQRSLDVTAHNIANVNTAGYKNRRAAFEELLQSNINANNNTTYKVGHGVKQQTADLLYSQSALGTTAFPLDFAIKGEGFFSVQRGTRVEYTRSGNFNISAEQAGNYLVTDDGAYVLNKMGEKITIPQDAKGAYNFTGLKENIAVYGFKNPYALESVGNTRFLPTANSGGSTLLAQSGQNSRYELVEQALEHSAVDLGAEMISMISSQRSFQLNARVLQTADAMDDLVNNLR